MATSGRAALIDGFLADAEVLGSRSRASEILNGKREMSLDHIRRLSKAWGIPIAMLVGEAETASTASAA